MDSRQHSADLIRARDLAYRIGDQSILSGVDLGIEAGGFTTLVGPNGAGKTTLLKLLMGLIRPTSGAVERRPGLRTAYVPQRLVLPPSMPMRVGRFIRTLPGLEAAEVDRALDQVGLPGLAQRDLHSLSGGEYQRVLLARALAARPELLILDEPAQNLDFGGQLAFYRLIENLYREGRTAILMVSHDLHLVMACTTQVVCLYGHVCCLGEPQAVARDPAFVELFGPEMARMMAVYHHHHHHSHEEGGDHVH